MPSIKLSITCAKALRGKYDDQALTKIDAAIAAWVAADKARGFQTIHLAIDDAAAMKKHGAQAVKGVVTAEKVKKALDKLVRTLRPDYIVLFGSTDVIPSFEVSNPVRDDDEESTVPTDNPYASSHAFKATERTSYLIPDRVLGRIPDVPGSGDSAWLVSYLRQASAWKPAPRSKYDRDLLVCAYTWRDAGRDCVGYLGRDKAGLMLAPPVTTGNKKIRARHGALLHMLKCHGSGVDSQFYGQKGQAYPATLRSTALKARTRPGTVVGAMCCYGASVFDPEDPSAAQRGEPPLPSMYLKQGAYGMLGSTNTAYVGADDMQCADWVVSGFLKAMLGGASLGRAALEGKQDFVRWSDQQGQDLDSADEKTLLQFVLLGDPSIHPVLAGPATVGGAALELGLSSGATTARSARRAARRELGALLRANLPAVTRVAPKVPAHIRAFAVKLAKKSNSHSTAPLKATGVRRVERRFSAAPTLGSKKAAGRAAAKRVSLHYHLATKQPGGPVKNVRVISIHADSEGHVVRSQVLVTS